MASRMNWDKVRRDRMQIEPYSKPKPCDSKVKPRPTRQAALEGFVQKHSLNCFKCHRKSGPWARTGFGKRGPWAICRDCVRR
jgi:hypothetical protein